MGSKMRTIPNLFSEMKRNNRFEGQNLAQMNVLFFYQLQVTKRKITIINGSDENKWTTIQPIVMDPTKPEAVHLGHVGELHYVSMRPVVETGKI